jgi:hypothetical protein
VPNDPSGIRHNREHGERIASLERDMAHIVDRINHLDECVDSVKVQAEEIAEESRNNARLWDRRWWVGIGIMGTLVFVSGSGVISLKELIQLVAKVTH